MGRKEEIAVDSYVHVLNRGAKKLPIYKQQSDLWKLLFNLYYLNSEKIPENWSRQLKENNQISSFVWPKSWGEKKPIVSVLAYVIMPNHFHLILKEIKEGGISEFMHKFSMSYSKYFNTKHKESGSLFQGRFKSITAEDDNYLRYLAVYVMVKNTFELYPGGFEKAVENFDDAYEWAVNYPFCSLADYSGKRKHSQILEKDLLGEIFKDPKDFKEFAEDCILGRALGDFEFE